MRQERTCCSVLVCFCTVFRLLDFGIIFVAVMAVAAQILKSTPPLFRDSDMRRVSATVWHPAPPTRSQPPRVFITEYFRRKPPALNETTAFAFRTFEPPAYLCPTRALPNSNKIVSIPSHILVVSRGRVRGGRAT